MDDVFSQQTPRGGKTELISRCFAMHHWEQRHQEAAGWTTSSSNLQYALDRNGRCSRRKSMFNTAFAFEKTTLYSTLIDNSILFYIVYIWSHYVNVFLNCPKSASVFVLPLAGCSSRLWHEAGSTCRTYFLLKTNRTAGEWYELVYVGKVHK